MLSLGKKSAGKGGITIEPISQKLLEILKQEAKRGDKLAQMTLGNLYFNGAEGVPQDATEARKWFLMAGEQGDSEAQYRVGMLFKTAPEPERDWEQAEIWLSKSARQGNQVSREELFELTRLRDAKKSLWVKVKFVLLVVIPMFPAIYFGNDLIAKRNSYYKVGHDFTEMAAVASQQQMSEVRADNNDQGIQSDHSLNVLSKKPQTSVFTTTPDTITPERIAEVVLPNSSVNIIPTPSSPPADELTERTKAIASNPALTSPVSPILGHPAKREAYIAGENVNLRRTPRVLLDNKIALLQMNQKIVIRSEARQDDNFTWVELETTKGEIGWVRGDFVNARPVSKGKILDSSAKVMSDPDFGSFIIDTPKKGTEVVILEQNEKWLRVRYGNGISGWTIRPK